MGGRLTEVVKNLIIINVLVYFATTVGPGYALRPALMMYNPFIDSNFQVWQVFTHMFMHDGRSIGHLFFNMFTLYMFGPILENKFGSLRFLFFYLLSGLGAMLVHVLVAYFLEPHTAYALLGASGAIYGVLIAFMLYYPNVQLMLLFPPIPMKAKYLIGGFLVLDLTMGVLGSGTGVAHFAHVGGAIFGYLMVTYWRRTGEVW